jgi:uncharacterized Zn finger protein (UPF0148 family)
MERGEDLERIVTQQMTFGKSCARCRSYFVTSDEGARVCPWCAKTESGQTQNESYEFPDR